MSFLDIVIVVLILFGIINGFIKGLFVEVASIVALIAGVYGAVHFSNFAAKFLSERVEWDEKTINITAFAITFIIIVLAITLAGKALTKLANLAALGLLNRLLGAIFGGFKYALIISVLLIIFDKVNNSVSYMSDDDLEKSVLYKPVKSLIPLILPSIIETVEEKTSLDSEIV
ncbi:CvpA family protein [Aestuariivivens sp. NBU2969]|uniref:CvpA family protein n=1 Tax=Aestuariivivens sp. NBU2969 TaxID=2873267 RepID=UPI001CBE4199|nr:CvpA family protein [Aestuariivivens sp. NBU2969]